VQARANLEAKDNVGPHAQGGGGHCADREGREGTQVVYGYVESVFGVVCGCSEACACLYAYACECVSDCDLYWICTCACVYPCDVTLCL